MRPRRPVLLSASAAATGYTAASATARTATATTSSTTTNAVRALVAKLAAHAADHPAVAASGPLRRASSRAHQPPRPPAAGQPHWRCLATMTAGRRVGGERDEAAAWRTTGAKERLWGGGWLRRLVQTKKTARAAEDRAAAAATEEGVSMLPHRRRQARRRAIAGGEAAQERPTRTETQPSSGPPHLILPTNASTTLTDLSAKHASSSVLRHLSAFLALSKPRLTTLVVLSAMAPYALYPVPAFLSADAIAAAAPTLSPVTLLFLTTGTALCSASANALNMLYEPGTDALMSRTRNRPLVRALLSRRAALAFAVATGAAGAAALFFGVNPTVAFLGSANIVLYAGVYTPLKAVTVLNTWIGAVVGGIPPLMGWAAAAGESATGDGAWRELLFADDGSSAGGWLLASLLFAWQFPHFMALSCGIRDEYRAAGLRMLAWTNPARNARVALRYSLAFLPICIGLCAAGVTEWTFAATSLPVNAWLGWRAVGFWRLGGGGARGLFWASVWHLPAVMVLALLQKKGMWGGIWQSMVGTDEEAEWEEVEAMEGMKLEGVRLGEVKLGGVKLGEVKLGGVKLEGVGLEDGKPKP